MKTSDLLRESVATTKPPKMSDFPKSIAILSATSFGPKQLIKFEEALGRIAEAVKAGEVVNTALVDIKSSVDNFVEYTYKAALPVNSFRPAASVNSTE